MSNINFSLILDPVAGGHAQEWAALFDKLAHIARAGDLDKATKVRARMESGSDWIVVVEEETVAYREF